MSGPIRIVFVINELIVGGAQRVVLNIIYGLPKDQFAPTLVLLKDAQHVRPGAETFLSELQTKGIPYIELHGTNRRFSWLREAIGLFRIIRRIRPQIVHTHLPYAGILGRVIAWCARVPSILSTQHNFEHSYPQSVRWMERATFGFATQITCVYEEIENALFGSSAVYEGQENWQRASCTLFNGVDVHEIARQASSTDRALVRAQLGLDEDAAVIIMVGRFIFWKGQSYLIDALPVVLRAHPHVKLLLVGSGSDEAALREQAAKEGVTSSVIFAGARKDIPALLAVSTIFASPYTHDKTAGGGFGITFLEAMAVGLPVVSTHGPGIGVVVRDGETGLLVAPKNSGELARAFCILLAETQRARALGQAGKELAFQQFSVEHMVQTYRSLYVALLARTLVA